MTTTRVPARTAAPLPPELPRRLSLLPMTTDERLKQIEVLRQRIDQAVDFLCSTRNGTSAEAKEKAIVSFHERMVLLEGQLSRIKEELLLG